MPKDPREPAEPKPEVCKIDRQPATSLIVGAEGDPYPICARHEAAARQHGAAHRLRPLLAPSAWKPGDRVRVAPSRRGGWVKGTVTQVDERGVFVDLDTYVNGVKDCYASHRELVREY